MHNGKMQEREKVIRTGMVGLGMIFDETYRPFFNRMATGRLFAHDTEPVDIRLTSVASRTGTRAERYRLTCPESLRGFQSLVGTDSALTLALREDVDVVCVATPDDRHFEPALAAIRAGKHVLVEKPSVLRLQELDDLTQLSTEQGVLAKVVYHKIFDPDHKKLRTHVLEGTLQHVNSGYCTLLEPRSIATGQFAEWVVGRNPASYVAVHYLKLIDFTFGGGGRNWKLARVTANGQRGIIGPAQGRTWDSVLLQVVYVYPDGREAAFDIHTSWVTPDNFTGYVDQEVQFRFDNAIWLGHQRKRGVEVAIEGRTPHDIKNTPNHHYNGAFIEPWGERCQRGYGIEAIERFFTEVAYVEFGGSADEHSERVVEMSALEHNSLAADRNCVAIVQSLEAILDAQAAGEPGGVVKVNGPAGGLALYLPGHAEPRIVYAPKV